MGDYVINASALDSLKGVLNKLIDNRCYDRSSGREMLVLCFHYIIKMEGKAFLTKNLYLLCHIMKNTQICSRLLTIKLIIDCLENHQSIACTTSCCSAILK